MNFYDSIIEGAQELPANERGQLYAAILEYLYYRREPDFPMKPAPKAIYVSFRPILDNQLSASERGKKGGRPRKQESKAKAEVSENEKPNETTGFQKGDGCEKQTESKAKAEVSEKAPFSKSEQEQEQELEKEPLRGSKKTRPRFVPPTEEEVDAYLAERGISAYLTGAQFVGYYGSQDWRKANGQKVTNWKLAASGWADRERKRNPQRGGSDGFEDFNI